MRSFVVLCLLAAFTATNANPVRGILRSDSANTLLSRALGLSAENRETRPTGQCIVTCDDRMIALKRCPDGECPDYDCRSGYANCGVR